MYLSGKEQSLNVFIPYSADKIGGYNSSQLIWAWPCCSTAVIPSAQEV